MNKEMKDTKENTANTVDITEYNKKLEALEGTLKEHIEMYNKHIMALHK